MAPALQLPPTHGFQTSGAGFLQVLAIRIDFREPVLELLRNPSSPASSYALPRRSLHKPRRAPQTEHLMPSRQRLSTEIAEYLV